MKTLCRIVALMLASMLLASCSAVKQESAMDWLARQPVFTDDP